MLRPATLIGYSPDSYEPESRTSWQLGKNGGGGGVGGGGAANPVSESRLARDTPRHVSCSISSPLLA